MMSELEAVSVKPTQYFKNYFDMLSFLHIEVENVDKITLYFARKGGSFEMESLLNFNRKYNFPPLCQITTKDNKIQSYKFDYSHLEKI